MAYARQVLLDNRHGLLLGLRVTAPQDNAEGKAACALLDGQKRQGIGPDSLGADRGDCQRDSVQTLRSRGIGPHIARIEDRCVAGLDGRTTGSTGYAISQRVAKRIEECFAWLHAIGATQKVEARSRAKVEMA